MAINYLKPDKIISLPLGLSVKQKLIPDSLKATKKVSSWIKKGDPMKPNALISGNGKPRGVTIHNTPDIKVSAATNPAEQYCRATYNGNMGGAMVHYYVWRDQIWQLLRHNEQGWHAGDKATRKPSRDGKGAVGGNLDTIAIECIGDDPMSQDTTAKLAAYLLHEHGLTVDNGLYTHQYFSGKYCPAYILPHWDGFAALVKRYCNSLKPVTPAPVPTTAPAVAPFPDVAPGAWYAQMIAELKAAGIVNGYPDGTVRPEAEALRAELFSVAYKLLKMIHGK